MREKATFAHASRFQNRRRFQMRPKSREEATFAHARRFQVRPMLREEATFAHACRFPEVTSTDMAFLRQCLLIVCMAVKSFAKRECAIVIVI